MSKEIITGGDCVDCGTPVELVYWGGHDAPDEWECPKCEGRNEDDFDDTHLSWSGVET